MGRRRGKKRRRTAEFSLHPSSTYHENHQRRHTGDNVRRERDSKDLSSVGDFRTAGSRTYDFHQNRKTGHNTSSDRDNANQHRSTRHRPNVEDIEQDFEYHQTGSNVGNDACHNSGHELGKIHHVDLYTPRAGDITSTSNFEPVDHQRRNVGDNVHVYRKHGTRGYKSPHRPSVRDITSVGSQQTHGDVGHNVRCKRDYKETLPPSMLPHNVGDVTFDDRKITFEIKDNVGYNACRGRDYEHNRRPSVRDFAFGKRDNSGHDKKLYPPHKRRKLGSYDQRNQAPLPGNVPSFSLTPSVSWSQTKSDRSYPVHDDSASGRIPPSFRKLERASTSKQKANERSQLSRVGKADKSTPFGYKRLERMSTDENISVLYELAAAETSLEMTLNQTAIRRDLMTLLLKVLSKACRAGVDNAPENTIIVLSVVRSSTFLKEHLLQHISKMKNDSLSATLEDNVRDCVILFRSLLKHLPSTRDQVGVLLDLITNASNTLITKGEEFNPTTMENIEDLQKQHAASVYSAPEGDKERHKRKGYTPAVEPPNDFRELSVFPSLDELRERQRPYLRQNVVRGKYQNLQHYLDVQFRLLREDFVGPLRDGIAGFKTYLATNKKMAADIRVYHKVRILYPVCASDNIVYRIQFDQSVMRGIRWSSSKRLIYGSLVCLSADNFHTAIFGTVANRDPKHIVRGVLDVDFQGDIKHHLNNSLEFSMVESVAFFEAYRHVLRGLKEITENSLPFKNHILKVSPHVNHPRYLRKDADMRFDLRALLTKHADDISTQQARDVTLLDRKTWPSRRQMQLDQSQLKAVYSALTNEVSVIQGPPGSGKTHVGLKVMQVLLENRRKWSGIEDDIDDAIDGDIEDDTDSDIDDNDDAIEEPVIGPILVVCYTNHALDQFLEGILHFNRNLVRVGGRSKSDRLIPHNLNRIRDENRIDNAVANRSLKNCRNRHTKKANKIRDFIQQQTDLLEDSSKGVISMVHLEPYMTQEQKWSLSSDLPIAECILYWLDLVDDFTQYANSANQWGKQLKKTPTSVDTAYEEELLNPTELLPEDRDGSDDESLSTHTPDDDEKRTLLAFNVNEFRRGYERRDDNSREYIAVAHRVADHIQEAIDNPTRLSSVEANAIKDVWGLSFDAKWKLYRYWASCFRQNLIKDVLGKVDRYKTVTNALKEVRDEEDYQILRDSDVIGMTTTRAARSRAILQRVKPKIILIEEAAEVLEAHIVTTLSSHCQQLILIGDHQQLRPNPTVYRLAKDYNLDVSLFERMVKNDLPYERLTLQHRMRPAISLVMKKHFYPKLVDDESVTNLPDVRGVCGNVYFLDHSYPESAVRDTQSRSNLHEAEVLVALCRYLLQQEYKPSQITVLTTYTGQLFNFKRLMNNRSMEGVRACVVDNFQGEESDIILLSLVRSNDEGSIGFLKVSNRVCVALSRAKHGLFCIGNFGQLSKQSKLWMDITNTMRSRKLLGSAITLACAMHPQNKTKVSSVKDFKLVPEGGCRRLCEFRLDCGHVCDMPCHPRDPEHLQYQCTKVCSKKICDRGHLCRNRCFEACPKMCQVPVDKVLPRCGHTQKVPCYGDPEFADCRSRCDHLLKCGHACAGLCGESCEKYPCRERIPRDLSCGHSGILPCSASVDACPVPCTAILRCEHQCTGTCGTCFQGRVHKACTQKCDRVLVCGHICKEPCVKTCPPCRFPCENRCKHSRCKNKCGEPCVPCREPCGWQCQHKRCSKTCGEVCDRDVCDQPCTKIQNSCRHIRHPCIGVCGEPCPEKCRFCDREEVSEIFFGNEQDRDARFILLEDCRHLVEVSGLDHWMSLEEESENGESTNIHMKGCPKCKTPIRRSYRYGNIIKKKLADVERVKTQVKGDIKLIMVNKKAFQDELDCLKEGTLINEGLERMLRKRIDRRLGLQEIVALRNELDLYGLTQRLEKETSSANDECADLRRQLNLVKNRLFNDRPLRGGKQEVDELSFEIERLNLCWQMHNVKRHDTGENSTVDDEIQKCVEQLGFLEDGTPLTAKNRDKARGLLRKCRELCGGLAISEIERKMIVAAVGLSSGHWFKCPNGHIYAIGECGDAMEERRCPECDQKIGGGRHRLRSDNAFATEMDGSRHAAWSDQANMGNYILDDIWP